MGPVDGASRVTTSYTRRGVLKRVGGSYDTLIKNIKKDADGATREITYGDVAGTTTHFTYDSRRRLSTVQTYRGPPPLWSTANWDDAYDGDSLYATGNRETFQLLLEDQDFVYDSVDNPTEIRDWRIREEWPEGGRP